MTYLLNINIVSQCSNKMYTWKKRMLNFQKKISIFSLIYTIVEGPKLDFFKIIYQWFSLVKKHDLLMILVSWWPEGSFFNSYYMKVWGRALRYPLDFSIIPLIIIFSCRLLSNAASSTTFESLVWVDLGLNPGLPDHWWTLYSFGQ